jgi:hypothetical protein
MMSKPPGRTQPVPDVVTAAQIEASLQRIGQGKSTPDDADLWRAVWDALQSVTKTLGIQADVLRSPDEAVLMIQYQKIAAGVDEDQHEEKGR